MTLAGAVVVLLWRVKETQSAVTVPKIIIPPLGMSTGLCMFFVEETRVPLLWGVGAFIIGAVLFAIPLMRSSKLTRVGDQILMERSRAFLVILLALMAVRFGLRAWVEHLVSAVQSGALLYLLALGAIVRWRVTMLFEFRRLLSSAA